MLRLDRILALLLPLLVGCGSTKQPMLVPNPTWVKLPKRILSDWTLDKAKAEAEKDIAEGTMKIYVSGDVAPGPAGISPELAELINGLPWAEAGIGCIISGQKEVDLREAQYHYALEYNRRVVDHLRRVREGLTPRSSRTQPAQPAFPSIHSSFITSFSCRSQVGPLSCFR
jgi:hypothetical protein